MRKSPAGGKSWVTTENSVNFRSMGLSYREPGGDLKCLCKTSIQPSAYHLSYTDPEARPRKPNVKLRTRILKNKTKQNKPNPGISVATEHRGDVID